MVTKRIKLTTKRREADMEETLSPKLRNIAKSLKTDGWKMVIEESTYLVLKYEPKKKVVLDG